ncbi:MAG: sugar ABC transporter permease [Desulfobacterales bacterium]|nr:MAG: sugar ABC transporter permease [Desulfobacterales bacterium]
MSIWYRRESNGQWPIIALFVGPALLGYILLTIYPVLLTIYNSFFEIRPRNAAAFIGWKNYAALASDRTFWLAVRHTLIWALVAPVLEVVLGLLLAVTIYARAPLGRFFRVAWFSPVLISYVVVAIMWSWLYNYDWGLVNAGLRALNLEGLQRSWLGEPGTALWALIVVDVWKWTGFHLIVCLAAVHGLPQEVIESAEMDNCGWLGKIYFIVVPMLAPTLIGLLVLGFVGKMKVFDLVWIMTQGGPLWSTETVSTYVYKRAFDWNTFDLGYPCGIATVWFAAILLCVILFTTVFRQREKLEY